MLYFGAQNPEVVKIELDSIPEDKVIYDPQTIGKDTVALWFNLPAEELPDTIKGQITYFKHDSINNLVESSDKLRLAWVKTETKEEKQEREKQEKEREKAEKAGEEYVPPTPPNTFKVTMTTSGELNKDKNLDMEFDYPLTRFDSAAITLRMVRDGESDTTNVDFHFVQDTLNRRKYQLRAEWVSKAKYTLTMPAGVFANIAQEQNDSMSYNYTGSDPEQYAIVRVNVKSSHPKTRYILQLTNAQGRTQKQIFDVKSGDYIFEYVSPGDVMLRVVEDKNGNGKWDTGDMVAMRQPERTEIYKNEEGVELITTKANWEFDIAVNMDQLFAPVTMESVIKMIDDREDARLKKLAEERAKKQKQGNKNNSNGMGGFGGFGGLGGMMGGSGMGGGSGAGGMRTNTGF